MKTTNYTPHTAPSRRCCTSAPPQPLFCSLSEIGQHIYRAGLWPRVPVRSTIYKWRAEGSIITRPGYRGAVVVDIPATLAKLKNPFI